MSTFIVLIRLASGFSSQIEVQAINAGIARQMVEAQYAGSGVKIISLYHK